MPAWEFRAKRWAAAEQQAPEGCAIKGNVTEHGRIYHMPWSPWYGQIRIEADKGKRWFCTRGRGDGRRLAAGDGALTRFAKRQRVDRRGWGLVPGLAPRQTPKAGRDR